MKRRTLAAILMLLVFTLGCLVSAPVLRAEFPWDADLKSNDKDAYDEYLDSINANGGTVDDADNPDLFWYWWYLNKYVFPTSS